MKIKITVMRRSVYPDLMEKYENPLENPCEMTVGDVFISEGAQRPEGFCSNAWRCILPYVQPLNEGGGNFFDGWMKDERSAMVSCDDGFRPVSFYIQVIKE